MGDNTFQLSGMSLEELYIAFNILPHGVVKMVETYTNGKGEKETTVSVREI